MIMTNWTYNLICLIGPSSNIDFHQNYKMQAFCTKVVQAADKMQSSFNVLIVLWVIKSSNVATKFVQLDCLSLPDSFFFIPIYTHLLHKSYGGFKLPLLHTG